ncbi:stage III sporulation protein AF [Ruminiclostridium sufflavum DSM 19573]|uniref:Stage III sporulation protein AF n=1 Tax=Ruminiclostridium sufflavum DSM 19573 TaxID=1121337 RepID=A0A318XIF9_9FIRM|nr:stage III sporulation protein AF [Ruminiclostridium sufflavum]PYG86814.1 stage III sporulation protein AF [Ruminiclostridium sufflavum DSM 19573]
MLEFMKSWIINIVTISIILILFEIIIPSGKIKKIINLISGFILLIVIINPFIALKNQDYDLSRIVVSDSLYIDKKEIEKGSRLLNETQMKQIASVYKNKLISEIKNKAAALEGIQVLKVDVEINEDNTGDSFGEIKSVYIELKKASEQDKEKKAEDSIKISPVLSVRKVDITERAGKQKARTSKTSDPGSTGLAEKVKEDLNTAFEIPKDCIVVSIIE